MAPAIVVADTSVLINFLRIDRMDLIGRCPERFIATDHVAGEITDAYPDQQARYVAAIAVGHIAQERIDDPDEVALFLRLGASQRLGAGERSAIAVALNRGYALAIDDARALSRAIREAGLAGSALRIIRTQDIIVALIRAGVLTVEAADAIRVEWSARHRFVLKIGSFRDIL